MPGVIKLKAQKALKNVLLADGEAVLFDSTSLQQPSSKLGKLCKTIVKGDGATAVREML